MKNILELEIELKEIADLLYNKLNITSSFEDIDKSIKILEQKNENQYSSIVKKMKNFTRIAYETGILYNVNDNLYNVFVNKLKKIDEILSTIG